MTPVRWHSRAACGLRAPWGARGPWASGQPTGVAVHHTGGPGQRPPRTLADALAMWRATAQFHRSQQASQGYTDVAYNEAGALVDGVWHALEGRGTEWRPGASGREANATHYAIVLLGNYDTHDPPAGLAEGLASRIRQLNEWYRRPLAVTGHELLPGQTTACPGRHIVPLLPAVATMAATPAQRPQEAPPMSILGNVDRVTNDGPGRLRIQGWAGHDNGQPVAITVAIDGRSINRAPTLLRDDVARAHPAVAQPCGYDIVVDAAPGEQRLRVMVSAGTTGATIHDRTHLVFAPPPPAPPPPPPEPEPDRVTQLLDQLDATTAALRQALDQ